MPGNKVSRYKRKAAARGLFHAFSVLSSFVNTCLLFDGRYGWEDTFTEKELKYLDQLKARLHEDAEAVRKLAWRLEKQ